VLAFAQFYVGSDQAGRDQARFIFSDSTLQKAVDQNVNLNNMMSRLQDRARLVLSNREHKLHTDIE